MDIRKLKRCVCLEKQKGQAHEKRCLEKQFKVHESRLEKAKESLKKAKTKENERKWKNAYTSWWNCKQLLKNPELFSEMYKKRNEKIEKIKPTPVFKDCFCLNRMRARMVHEKQCLEKRKVIFWEKVEQAKKKNDLKERNKAYTVYYTNEKRLRWYEQQ